MKIQFNLSVSCKINILKSSVYFFFILLRVRKGKFVEIYCIEALFRVSERGGGEGGAIGRR